MSEIMTHEDFANICLRIKNGDTNTEIPCCGNCKYYTHRFGWNGESTGYVCEHPRLKLIGRGAWLVMQPEDFCSRYTERDNGRE